MSVTKSKLQLWDSKCAYKLCYLYVHDKSANAGTTLLGVLMWSIVKPPINNRMLCQTTNTIRKHYYLCVTERIGLVATCLSQ